MFKTFKHKSKKCFKVTIGIAFFFSQNLIGSFFLDFLNFASIMTASRQSLKKHFLNSCSFFALCFPSLLK